MKKTNQKGFTLVELMIVVAIIGILAAIAIPQFALYRIRGFNSSAQSDVRNLATSEAAFFSDWLVFGVTEDAAGLPGAGSVGATGAPIFGPSSPTHIITADDPAGTARGILIGLGNTVGIVAETNAAGLGIQANNSFTAIAKHANGDTYYAADSDTTAMFQCPAQNSQGFTLLPADIVASTAADDFTAAALACPDPGGAAVVQDWSAK